MTATATTTDMRQYPPRMRRSQVLELGRAMGLTDYAVRAMLEREPTPIPRIVYPGTTRAYYDRDTVYQAFQLQPT